MRASIARHAVVEGFRLSVVQVGGFVRVAVVGVGAAGLATALSLTDQAPETMDLTLFDGRFKDPGQSGRGYAYQDDRMAPLLNAPTTMMSVRADDEDDFARWVRRRTARNDVFVPRPVFGAYLSETLGSLKRQWISRTGTLHCVPSQVVSVVASDGKISVATANARFDHFDVVFLCIGWGTQTRPADGTVPAYPLDGMVSGAQGTAHVGVLGTGLTAVDVARALLSSGYPGQITLASRRGLLPGSRSTCTVVPAVVNRDAIAAMGSLDLRQLLRLVEREARAQGLSLDTPKQFLHGKITPRESLLLDTALEPNWRGLFVALCDDALADAWNLLDDRSRKAFVRWLHPYVQAWCNPMPPSTAAWLASAMDSGQLVVRGGLRRADQSTLIFADDERVGVDFLVSARRTASDPVADPNAPLVQSLIDGELAARDEFGGLRVEYGRWRLLGAEGTHAPVYAVGSLAQGARYYVNALDSILRTVPEAISDALRSTNTSVLT